MRLERSENRYLIERWGEKKLGAMRVKRSLLMIGYQEREKERKKDALFLILRGVF